VDTSRLAVERAIIMMWNHYDEPLSLDEIADSAILSKFYFSRVFRSVTGTSPGRFLTAIRLSRAKNLLQETTLTVTDIAYMVGYNSLGTFTTRFTRSVGVSPTRFRSLSHSGLPALPRPEVSAPGGSGTVHGTLTLPPSNTPLRIYVGAFEGPVVEGLPASCDVLDIHADGCRALEYRLGAVPIGQWYVRATAVAVDWSESVSRPDARKPVFVGSSKPVVMRADIAVKLGIRMRATNTIDLPILLALPELDNRLPPGPMQNTSRATRLVLR